jgi:hypothetical protein
MPYSTIHRVRTERDAKADNDVTLEIMAGLVEIDALGTCATIVANSTTAHAARSPTMLRCPRSHSYIVQDGVHILPRHAQ